MSGMPMMPRLFLFILLLSPICVQAAIDDRIKVVIEEPVHGETYSGISNLRGWVVSPAGTGDYVHDVFIDGNFAFSLPNGGAREDVRTVFPEYPDSDLAGWSMAFNYKSLPPGEHEIVIRAYDNAGNYSEASARFSTERFATEFVEQISQVDLSSVQEVLLHDRQSFLVKGAVIEGKTWEFLLRWDTAAQSFKTQDIIEFTLDSEGGAQHIEFAVYACETSPNASFYGDSEFVEMKNGMIIRNNAGQSWISSNKYTVFRTEDRDWYGLVELNSVQSELIRLDVTNEPSYCFEPLYETPVAIENRDEGKALVFEEGEFVVETACKHAVGTPLLSYREGLVTSTYYFVSLRDAETCEIISALEY